MKFIVIFISGLILSACSKQPDVTELSEYFFANQSDFNKLVDASCKQKAALGTKYHNYIIDTALEYPAHLASQFFEINALLKKINVKGIIIKHDTSVGCSLYIAKWSFGITGGSTEMGYSYQPAKLAEFNTEIHLQENRNLREKIHFTKPLAGNWYIEYRNIP